jgi:hypothetical protein
LNWSIYHGVSRRTEIEREERMDHADGVCRSLETMAEGMSRSKHSIPRSSS